MKSQLLLLDKLFLKPLELIHKFKVKSYDSLHHWFKRFREKYKYSIKKVAKISQSYRRNNTIFI